MGFTLLHVLVCLHLQDQRSQANHPLELGASQSPCAAAAPTLWRTNHDGTNKHWRWVMMMAERTIAVASSWYAGWLAGWLTSQLPGAARTPAPSVQSQAGGAPLCMHALCSPGSRRRTDVLLSHYRAVGCSPVQSTTWTALQPPPPPRGPSAYVFCLR
jgi:hypothetical protein